MEKVVNLITFQRECSKSSKPKMGCCNSSEAQKVAASSNFQNILVKDIGSLSPRDLSVVSNFRGKIQTTYEKIVAGVKMVACPVDMVPVFCMTFDAFPICVVPLPIKEIALSVINIPIVAGSYSQNGRVICISQLDFFSPKSLPIENTVNLLINIFNWTSGGNFAPASILVYSNNFELIESALKEMGYQCSKCNQLQGTDFNNYKLLIITTDITVDDPQLILQASANGCGIIFVYSAGSSVAGANYILQNYGLAFGDFAVNNQVVDFGRTQSLSYNTVIYRGNYEKANVFLGNVQMLQVQPNFSTVKDFNFMSVYFKLISILLQNQTDVSNLDDTVANIRYYIPACDAFQIEQLIDIIQKSFEYLNRTCYHSSDGICSLPEQKIIVILIQSIFQKLPLSSLPDLDCTDLFPGASYENNFEEVELSLPVFKSQWKSTGLWLPANKIATITINNIYPGIFIQVGSFTESIHSCRGLWKRWPVPCMTFPINQKTTKIATPFGGIVYVLSTQEDCQEVDLIITGCCKYPRYSEQDSSLFTETKNRKTPLSEIESRNIIVTLPTSNLMTLSHEGNNIVPLSHFCEKMDELIPEIANFFYYKGIFQTRLVFDIQVPHNQLVCGYPIVDVVDNIEKIMVDGIKTPNAELFILLSTISLLLLQENTFGEKNEAVIALFAAAKALSTIYPEFDPSIITLPSKFDVLWDIDKQYSKCIPEAIQQVCIENMTTKSNELNNTSQNDEAIMATDSAFEDSWMKFVNALSSLAKINFFPAFHLKNPPSDVEAYPEFQK